jgi:hypothetical protein
MAKLHEKIIIKKDLYGSIVPREKKKNPPRITKIVKNTRYTPLLLSFKVITINLFLLIRISI